MNNSQLSQQINYGFLLDRAMDVALPDLPAAPPPVDTATTNAAIKRLRRRLHAWELDHLRQHAAELAAQVESLNAQLDSMTRERDNADRMANFWHEEIMRMGEALESDAGASHRAIGLTQDGALMVVQL